MVQTVDISVGLASITGRYPILDTFGIMDTSLVEASPHFGICCTMMPFVLCVVSAPEVVSSMKSLLSQTTALLIALWMKTNWHNAVLAELHAS